MEMIFKKSVVAVLIGLLSTALMASAKNVSSWQIDKELKFSLTFLPDEAKIDPAILKTFKNVLSLKLSKEELPDISNISLSAILSLGFSLPKPSSGEEHNLFLKLFPYPNWLNSRRSVMPIISAFLLDQLQGYENMDRFTSINKNVVVKLGMIAPSKYNFTVENPYPRFRLPTKKNIMDKKSLSPQEYFDNSIPFSSLYVVPISKYKGRSNNEKAKWSAEGVLSFHREIIEIYENNLTEITENSDSKERVFIKETYSQGVLDKGRLIEVIRIQRSPLVFENYRDLPMPQDPKKIFLSGLLLINRSYYFSTSPNSKITLGTLEKDYVRSASHVLEVGSVVRFDH